MNIYDLFSNVVTVSYQCSPVILLVWGVRLLMGNQLSAAWRYALWMLVVIRLLVPLSWLPRSHYSLYQVEHLAPSQMRLVESFNPIQDSSDKSPKIAPVVDPILVLPAAPPSLEPLITWQKAEEWVWLGIAASGLIFIVISQIHFYTRIWKSKKLPSTRLVGIWKESSVRMKASHPPVVWLSSCVRTPVLLGIWRSRIVLPENAESYTDEECAHIFAHELAHFCRADHWTNFLQLVVLAIHWFNPLVWLSFYCARLDRELAADERALLGLRLTAPRTYGATLLKLITAQSGGVIPGTVGIAEGISQLKNRMRSIARFTPHSRLRAIMGAAVLVLFAVPILSRQMEAANGYTPSSPIDSSHSASSSITRGSILDRNGVILAETVSHKRRYPYQALAAHILGAIESSDGVGVESEMDGFLDDGESVSLTIDAQTQQIVQTAMRNGNVERGAVIVMDPNNGDILALASFPDYDPTVFDNVTPEDDGDPLMNRAVHGYAPGSTFKILVALAGLKSGKVTPETQFDCPGAIQIDDHVFHNSDSKDAGLMSLRNAIRVSNDTFFYQFAIKTGIQSVDDLAKRAGFGHSWSLLEDDQGAVPGPEWLAKRERQARAENPEHRWEEHWSDSQTANTSIGQGYTLVTPLQLSTFICSVANGGTVYYPRLYKSVVKPNGQDLAINPDFPELKDWTTPARVFDKLDVDPNHLATIQEGMLDVVQSDDGTGRLARVPGVEVAGKTGTAQSSAKLDGMAKRDLKCWFTCYAPYQHPRYVVTVLVEGGTWGGTSCGPIAKEILTKLFRKETGIKSTVRPVPPLAPPSPR